MICDVAPTGWQSRDWVNLTSGNKWNVLKIYIWRRIYFYILISVYIQISVNGVSFGVICEVNKSMKDTVDLDISWQLIMMQEVILHTEMQQIMLEEATFDA